MGRAQQRWQLLSNNNVSNVAQQFTPQDFWTKRQEIAAAMLTAVNDTLWEHGHVMALKFQIMKVDFAPKYEDSITAVQVAQQMKVIKEYTKNVTQVVQDIAVLKSAND